MTACSPGWFIHERIVKKKLIVGIGNADRQDDGVAWHILNRLAERLDYPLSSSPEVGYDIEGRQPELLFVLQLTPELAELFNGFKQICFIDAHTGAVPEEVQAVPVKSEYQASPFTHHMTPAAGLALSQALYGSAPSAILVSVRGYEFGFARTLSPRTDELVEQAVDRVWEWLHADPEQPV